MSSASSSRWRPAGTATAGLRDRLVHEYDDIDDAKVFAAVGTILSLSPQYIAAIESSLQKVER